MTTANWNTVTINGAPYIVIPAPELYVPLDWDPSSNIFIAVAAPGAGILANLPGLLQGVPGDTPGLDTVINLTELAYNDPTAASASFAEIGSDLYQLSLALHAGTPGDDGVMAILSASDLDGDGTPGQIIVVNAGADGFVFATQRVGDRYVPSTINSMPSGNSGYTLASRSIGPLLYDWRPEVEGSSILTPTGSDATYDLVCRLSNSNSDGGETSGNDVGRAFGLPMSAGVPVRQKLDAGPPPGSSDAYDRVPAGQIATVFFRAERQSGSDTATTSATTTRFKVRAAPCPTDVT